MAVRRRRTAEQSRANILEVAAARLDEFGLEGLNIKGVAEQAGISHATLIHHFGSSGGMRDALADKMSMELITDLTEALSAKVPPEELVKNVFDAFTTGGHAKLLAWRHVEEQPKDKNLEPVVEMFNRLLKMTREVLDVETDAQARQLIYLVAIAAIGHGIAGDMLRVVLGMPDSELAGFPSWMANTLGGWEGEPEDTPTLKPFN